MGMLHGAKKFERQDRWSPRLANLCSGAHGDTMSRLFASAQEGPASSRQISDLTKHDSSDTALGRCQHVCACLACLVDVTFESVVLHSVS